MIYLCVDPGHTNIGIVVCKDDSDKSIEILFSTTISIIYSCIKSIHRQCLAEIYYLLDFYSVHHILIENQQKGTAGKIYLHNLYNTNVQGICTAMAFVRCKPYTVIDPKVWNVLLDGQTKGIKMYRELTLPIEILNRHLLKTVHEYDACMLLISHLINK